MSQNNAFNAWGAPAQAPIAPSPAPQTPQPGFPQPPAPAHPQPAQFGAPSAHAPSVPAGFGAPAGGGFGAAAPTQAQAGGAPGFGIAFDPFGSFKPEIGFGNMRFPDENGLHLVRIDCLKLHNGNKGFRQVVETTVIASTSAGLVPGQKPSVTFLMTGNYANKEKTRLLAACAGYQEGRDNQRIEKEIDGSVHALANLTTGSTLSANMTLADLQGPGAFAGRYVLAETWRKASNKDPSKFYTNIHWHAVPQPPQGQSYTDEQIRAILARQYELPIPPPVGQ